MNLLKENKGKEGIYNVLSNNQTVREIVDYIKEIIPSIDVELVDSKIMNQLSYEVSNKRFMERGFTFCDKIDENIHNTINIIKRSGQ